MNRIELIFGTQFTKDGGIIKPLQLAQALHAIRRRAANFFGGYTLTFGYGGWIDLSGKFIEEESATLILYCKGEDVDIRPSIQELIAIIKAELNQAEVIASTQKVQLI